MTRRRISDLRVERLALGELHGAEAEAVRAALEAENDDRLEAIGRSNEAILAELAPQVVAAEVRRRASQTRTSPTRYLWTAVPAMAAASLALWVVVRGGPESGPVEPVPVPALVVDGPTATPDTVRIKGDERTPDLVVHRKRGDDSERLKRGQAVHAGDVLQVSYVAAGCTHGVVLSIDGAGVVTLHHPPEVGASTELQPSGEIPLPHGYELDDAPGFERFFFVTPVQPGAAVDTSAILEAAGALAREPDAARDRPLPVPDGSQQSSFTLRKIEP